MGLKSVLVKKVPQAASIGCYHVSRSWKHLAPNAENHRDNGIHFPGESLCRMGLPGNMFLGGDRCACELMCCDCHMLPFKSKTVTGATFQVRPLRLRIEERFKPYTEESGGRSQYPFLEVVTVWGPSLN